MAHKLNFDKKTGKYAFASAKEKAWHGLGQIFNRSMTTAEAIEQALLGFYVDKLPALINIPGVGLREVPGTFGTYRTDTNVPLGSVGSKYTIIQNIEAFSFFDAITNSGEAIIETAGAIGNGEKIFITAKMPSYIRVGKDEIEKYLFLQSTHDGSGSIIAAFTPVRIVCNNTLNAALRNCSNKISVRHTKDAAEKLKEAHKVMGLANMLSIELEGIFNQMAKVQITDKQLQDFIVAVMMPPLPEVENEEVRDEVATRTLNKLNEIFEYAMTAPSQQTASTQGTVFGAYNAITGYYQNVKTSESSKKTAQQKAENKLQNIMTGEASQKQQKAFNLALELVKA